MKYHERQWNNDGTATAWEKVTVERVLDVLQRQFVEPELALEFLHDAGTMTVFGTELMTEEEELPGAIDDLVSEYEARIARHEAEVEQNEAYL